jgi:hypothetical protein
VIDFVVLMFLLILLSLTKTAFSNFTTQITTMRYVVRQSMYCAYYEGYSNHTSSYVYVPCSSKILHVCQYKQSVLLHLVFALYLSLCMLWCIALLLFMLPLFHALLLLYCSGGRLLVTYDIKSV